MFEEERPIRTCLPWLSSFVTTRNGLECRGFHFHKRLPPTSVESIRVLADTFFLFLVLLLRPLPLSLVPFLSPSLSLVAAAMQPSVPQGNVIQWKAKRNIVLLRLLDSKEYGQSHRGKRVQNAICYSKKYDWRGRTLELESIRREAKEKGRMKIRRFHVWCAG